jgi:hypothetical protein
MVFEEIEKLPARCLSIQRWKVLQEIVVLGLEGNENCKESRKLLSLNAMFLIVSPWPSDTYLDVHVMCEDIGEYTEN